MAKITKRKAPPRRPYLESMKKIIPQAVHYLGPEFERQYRERYALYMWPQLVGESIANNVRPYGLELGVLWLWARNPTWQEQIHFLSKQILDKVNNCAGRQVAKSIKFRRMNQPIKWETRFPTVVFDNSLDEENKRRQEIRGTNLTEEEIGAIKNQCAFIEDEELRQKLIQARIAAKKAEKWKTTNQWPTCADCGVFIAPGEKLCTHCSAKRDENIRSQVRRTLMDMPWLRPAEVKGYVPDCTIAMVNYQRSLLVQSYARKIKLEDTDSIDAKFLVMLYKVIPPTQLTKKIITETLYRLRDDLARPLQFRAVRRKDYIKDE